MLSHVDPDIITGYELLSLDLDIYLNKLNKKLVQLDSLGRFSSKIKIHKKESIKYLMRKIFSGRLVADVYELAKTSVKLESYDLQDVINHYFDSSIEREDKIHKMIENSVFILKIASHLKLFPLTLQLSQIAGCLWEMSLRQSRAERNEVLLCHEFYKQGYILPDPKARRHKRKSKAKYLGGKVLDPITGFYDTYVVLVDFNSLYPSIIRQYDICFTTVKRSLIEPGYQVARADEFEDEFGGTLDPIKQLKRSDNPTILPKILSKLIEKRKLIKKELKSLKKRNKK